MPEGREEVGDDEASAVGRLVAVIVSAGLAWAIAIALAAWVLGFLLAR